MAATKPHLPTRTCVGCRLPRPQRDLVRFVRGSAGWRPDPPGGRRQDGRGVYLCSAACAARSIKNKRYPGLAAAGVETVFQGINDDDHLQQ